LLIVALAAAGCNTAQLATPEGEAGGATAAGVPATEVAAEQAVAPVPKELPAVLAQVNGESVERWELEMAIREIEGLSMHPIPASQRDKVYRTVLDRLIGHHLAAQEARASNLQVSTADVDAAVAAERRDFPNAEAFEKSLEEIGTSLDHFRRQRRLSLEVERFIQATILPGITVPAGDVESYYTANLDQYQRPETLVASHILIRIYPDSTEQQKNDARTRAAAILTRLRGGADFAATARQESQDTATASQGGSLGTITRGAADPAFDAVAFTLAPGELSNVVETPFGFHVIKAGQRQPARTVPLAEVRSQIEDELSQDVQQAKLAEWLMQARAKAKIEIYI
jgi:peptidyl-prolyl cis-trans isomerase C